MSQNDKKKKEIEDPKTYGNEPPVEDPKPRKLPDHYEVDDQSEGQNR